MIPVPAHAHKLLIPTHTSPPLLCARSANCLKNRHGEDQVAAVESGQWVCPPCRGTCGVGCVSCCNCGPCRKKVWVVNESIKFGLVEYETARRGCILCCSCWACRKKVGKQSKGQSGTLTNGTCGIGDVSCCKKVWVVNQSDLVDYEIARHGCGCYAHELHCTYYGSSACLTECPALIQIRSIMLCCLSFGCSLVTMTWLKTNRNAHRAFLRRSQGARSMQQTVFITAPLTL